LLVLGKFDDGGKESLREELDTDDYGRERSVLLVRRERRKRTNRH
jgi:hypothetical protein